MKIALGGGCHWCTEAVFQSFIGVSRVEQGYVASTGDESWFSEGVIVHFEAEKIPIEVLIEIHLHTHRSTSAHSFRDRYRSAVYTFSDSQKRAAERILKDLQTQFDKPLITQVLDFKTFESSREGLQDYYISNPNKPFCVNYINPKLKLLLQQFGNYINTEFIKD